MPDRSDISYFVCTLGEAQERSFDRPFRTVNHLIDKQAVEAHSLPAVGIYRRLATNGATAFQHDILTFKQLQQAVSIVARSLSKILTIPKGQTVGLLCSSSPEFLITWLACIRLGYPVLLVAPQCQPTGILHLCKNAELSVLLVDNNNAETGKNVVQLDSNSIEPTVRLQVIPFDSQDVFEKARDTNGEILQSPEICCSEIAYLHHTSGTSSGLPKVIPQSHHAAVGVLPAMNGGAKATFTTTPLYHGGPADIFRAWASKAMIWLFPSHELPITASNIVRCLECAGKAAQEGFSPSIRYFAAVPYVLQIMAENSHGLRWMRHMDIVGVGGAALPQTTGDNLVDQGINLVSRFGSAECGFLLSSHRDYVSDKDWQYLRQSADRSQVRFEAGENGLAELIVMSDWPHLAKVNREDGSYATSDLFEPHSRVKKAWKYHSRADAQLTLITGKKFDPQPIEAAIVAASRHVSDVLVFGNNRSYPGALIFRCEQASTITDEDLVQSVAKHVDVVNLQRESHATISTNMLIPMPYVDNPLPKSSKGTVIRNSAQEIYGDKIEEAYNVTKTVAPNDCADSDIPRIVANIVRDALGTEMDLPEDADFFALGLDSIAAMRIGPKVRQLGPKGCPRLPISIVEDTGSIKRLSEYLIAWRQGTQGQEYQNNSNQYELMRQLVNDYSRFINRPAVTSNVQRPPYETVVLTGVTGIFGAHVLDQLRSHPRVSRIFCLVRGADTQAAYGRVNKALEQRQLSGLESPSGTAEVTVVQSVLRDENLGLAEHIYDQIAKEASIIMHLAWSVNFRMKLQSFAKDSIASVLNLINLALAGPSSSPAKFVFCSSIASAMGSDRSVVPEIVLDDPTSAANMGYARSKWVAEQLCHRAGQLQSMCGKVSIFRVGQLSGDSQRGVWNMKEAWPMLLSSVRFTKSLPDLREQRLDWLPVDLAAGAMIEGALKDASEPQNVNVYHLLNDNASTRWSDLLGWLKERVEFATVQPEEWIRQLECAVNGGTDHAVLQLLDHWRSMCADEKNTPRCPELSTKRSKEVMPTMESFKAVDKPYFEKIWAWIDSSS